MPVTLADVAARAKVSPATVSRVLNGNYPVAEATRKRVEKAVRELDYVVNAHARALMNATSGIVGVVLNDVSDPFFAGITRGIQTAAAEVRRLVVICNSEGDVEREAAYVEMLRRQRADAIILVGASPDEPAYRRKISALARSLSAQKAALVLCARPAPDQSTRVHTVELDNRVGSAALTRHLIGLGHTSFAYICGPAGRTTTLERLGGFREALREARLPVDERLIMPGDFSRTAGYEATRSLLRDSPGAFTALIAANDLMAIGALAACREADVPVPDQVSVAGFDDIPSAVDVHPALTTVNVPLEEVGRQAMLLAFATPEAGTGRLIPATVVRRDSVAPPPA